MQINQICVNLYHISEKTTTRFNAKFIHFYVHAIFYFSIIDENVHTYYIFFLEGQIITVTDPKTGESIQQIIQTVIDPKTGKPKQIKTPINAGNDFLMKKTQI